MDILYYSKADRLVIGRDPFFPDDEEEIELPDVVENPPVLDEWKTYYARSYQEKEISISGAAERFVKRFPGNLFEINFQNYVGWSRIGNVDLNVQNRKISDSLYDAMLGYIADKFSDLVFSFDTPVGLAYEKDRPGRDNIYLQCLFLKKYLLDDTPGLDEITGMILARPHHKVLSETICCTADEMDRPDMGLLLSAFSNANGMVRLTALHPLRQTAAAMRVHERASEYWYPTEFYKNRKYHTFDTGENRFVKHFLTDILRLLETARKALGSSTYLNPDIAENVQCLKQKTEYFLSDPIWHDVGRMNFLPAQSTVLQRRDGYRHLFRLYALLNLVTRYQFDTEDFQNLIEMKDVPTLFEYWCFFMVKEILDKRVHCLRAVNMFQDQEAEKKLQEGIMITYEGGIRLLYNVSYSGSPGLPPEGNIFEPDRYRTGASYSHTLRPDIVIEKSSGSKLILDAKYKGKGGGFYGEEDEDGTISKYREEDLDKMHTYHDAIDHVFGAFALYPGNESKVFPAHDCGGSFQGVGALALKPVVGNMAEAVHIQNITRIIDAFIETP